MLTDLPFQLTWEATRLQPGAAGILVYFTGGEHGVEIGQGTPGAAGGAVRRATSSASSPASPSGASARRASTGRPSSGPRAATPATCRASGRRSAAPRASGWATSTSPASTARSTSRASWKGAARRGERAATEILVDLGLAQPQAEAARRARSRKRGRGAGAERSGGLIEAIADAGVELRLRSGGAAHGPQSRCCAR